jgi:hypothetical protein
VIALALPTAVLPSGHFPDSTLCAQRGRFWPRGPHRSGIEVVGKIVIPQGASKEAEEETSAISTAPFVLRQGEDCDRANRRIPRGLHSGSGLVTGKSANPQGSPKEAQGKSPAITMDPFAELPKVA